jgi:hypothetical protein
MLEDNVKFVFLPALSDKASNHHFHLVILLSPPPPEEGRLHINKPMQRVKIR